MYKHNYIYTYTTDPVYVYTLVPYTYRVVSIHGEDTPHVHNAVAEIANWREREGEREREEERGREREREREGCLLYTSPSPRDVWLSRMPSSA